jgi:hypothetical protein
MQMYDQYGSLQVLPLGPDGAPATPRTLTHVRAVNATAAGDTTVWTPAPGRRFVLLRVSIEASNTANVYLKDGAAQLTPQVTMTNSRGQVVYDFGPTGYRAAAPGNALAVNLGVAAASPGIGVLALGWEE